MTAFFNDQSLISFIIQSSLPPHFPPSSHSRLSRLLTNQRLLPNSPLFVKCPSIYSQSLHHKDHCALSSRACEDRSTPPYISPSPRSRRTCSNGTVGCGYHIPASSRDMATSVAAQWLFYTVSVECDVMEWKQLVYVLLEGSRAYAACASNGLWKGKTVLYYELIVKVVKKT